MKTFEQELQALLNRYSKENDSDTPDFVLAEYIRDCLLAFNKAVNTRTGYYEGDKFAKVVDEEIGKLKKKFPVDNTIVEPDWFEEFKKKFRPGSALTGRQLTASQYSQLFTVVEKEYQTTDSQSQRVNMEAYITHLITKVKASELHLVPSDMRTLR